MFFMLKFCLAALQFALFVQCNSFFSLLLSAKDTLLPARVKTHIYLLIFHAALPFHPVLSCFLCIILDHFIFGCLTFTSFLISVLVLMHMQMLVLLRCSQSILSCLPMALLQSMV